MFIFVRQEWSSLIFQDRADDETITKSWAQTGLKVVATVKRASLLLTENEFSQKSFITSTPSAVIAN